MPGAVTLTQVEMQLTVQGTVEDFDQARFKSRLGAYLEVASASISLDVIAARVTAKATIAFADASAAGSVVDALQGLASNLTAFSAAVGVTVESATDPVVSHVVIIAPSPPPRPSSPPPSPPAGLLYLRLVLGRSPGSQTRRGAGRDASGGGAAG